MRRALGLGVLWAAVACAATFVAWQGVAVVGEQVADDPSPVSSDVTDAAVEGTTTSTVVRPSAPTTTSTTIASPPATPPSVLPGSGPGAGSVVTTTAPPPPPPPAAPTGTARTYNLVGGDVALRFEAAGVTVLYATPRPGFTAEIGNSHSNGKSVRFESDDHRSEVVGWWDGGPLDEVREDD